MSGIDRNSQPLANVTTSSVEALKLYSRAADLYARGNLEGAPPLLQQALELDPKFAMAHRLMASVYGTLGNPARYASTRKRLTSCVRASASASVGTSRRRTSTAAERTKSPRTCSSR